MFILNVIFSLIVAYVVLIINLTYLRHYRNNILFYLFRQFIHVVSVVLTESKLVRLYNSRQSRRVLV